MSCCLPVLLQPFFCSECCLRRSDSVVCTDSQHQANHSQCWKSVSKYHQAYDIRCSWFWNRLFWEPGQTGLDLILRRGVLFYSASWKLKHTSIFCLRDVCVHLAGSI